MQVTLWGTRGTLATPGPAMVRYGGNTACVGVVGRQGTILVLDAGTGVRGMAATIPLSATRLDILLSHLHMDHIQGLGIFEPLFRPDLDVHVWGPGSATLRLRARLLRYLSPPLFPVNIAELPCKLTFHEVPGNEVEIGEFRVTSAFVCHPGPTVGYRVAETGAGVLVYLPDHEPALGDARFPSLPPSWTSGAALAAGADLLIHDSQYSAAEYPDHCGWGHSSITQALDFATLAEVKRLVLFHHDPDHTDDDLDRLFAQEIGEARSAIPVAPGMEGAVFRL